MKIKNLNVDSSGTSASSSPEADGMGAELPSDGSNSPFAAVSLPAGGEVASVSERQTLEIALLRVRIQHLELVIETARGLMGNNQERLLRRLYEVPRELVALSTQLRRIDPHFVW